MKMLSAFSTYIRSDSQNCVLKVAIKNGVRADTSVVPCLFTTRRSSRPDPDTTEKPDQPMYFIHIKDVQTVKKKGGGTLLLIPIQIIIQKRNLY